jgi:hypothetical protein
MDSEWVPEAHFVALNYAIFDWRGLSDAEALAWVRQRNRVLFSGTLYRMLMAVVSPEALLRFTSARWSAAHRGTSLGLLEAARGRARFELQFPLRLFDLLFLRMYGESFKVAIELTRVRDVEVTVEWAGESAAHYLARW